MIYLDSAATSFLKPPCVEQAVAEAFHTIGNAGRGSHAPTLNASRLLFETRARLAKLFHIENCARIGFTCNVTESLNLAVASLIGEKDQVLTTACEHNSVLRPLYRKAKEGTELTILPADAHGNIELGDLKKKCGKNGKAVVISHASNLTGNVTDLKEVSRFTKEQGLILIVDAAQTAGAMEIDVEELGIDVFCFTGHKSLLGPQGTGGIYVREGLSVLPFKAGGSGVHSFDREHPREMPAAVEAGTVNGHGIAGLCAALGFLEEVGVDTVYKREEMLARRFLRGVEGLPKVKLYGSLKEKVRAPIVSLNIGEMDSAAVCDLLWEGWEICVRGGAHCAPLLHEALGTRRQGAVRFSFSYFNTEEEIDTAIEAVAQLAQEYGEDA